MASFFFNEICSFSLVFRFFSVKLFKTFYYYIFKFVINFSVILQWNGFYYAICIHINLKLCLSSSYQIHTLFFYPALLVSFLLEDGHLLLSCHIYAYIVKYRFQTLEETTVHFISNSHVAPSCSLLSLHKHSYSLIHSHIYLSTYSVICIFKYRFCT